MTEIVEKFDRIYALMKFERTDLISWLCDYFAFNTTEGTDCYVCTPAHPLDLGDITIDDFHEFSQDMMVDLANFLLEKLKNVD